MKCRSNAGFSLVEMLVSIVILGLITIPMTSGMVLAMKTINRSETMMQAQLAVSSAVETLMATGITSTEDPNLNGVDIVINPVSGESYYNVIVTSEADDTVVVDTFIRKAGGGG